MIEEIYTVFASHDNITFIMKDIYRVIDETTLDGELISTEVVGWYYGEPNEENTAYFIGKLIATYE